MSLKSLLPQGKYFSSSWDVPGTMNKWTITGHSRALERTGFWLSPLRIVLDAGIDLPTDNGARPAAILITHGHIDHMNALPMLLRHMQDDDPPVQILAPASIVHRLRQFTQLSWSVKMDDTGIESDLPKSYQRLQVESERQELLNYCSRYHGNKKMNRDDVLTQSDERITWYAVKADQTMELSVGKKNATKIFVRTLRLFHGRTRSVGYILSLPAGTKKKLRPGLLGSNQKETNENIRQAKSQGEDIYVMMPTPEIPQFAFVLDTTIDALDEAKAPVTANRILSCPVVMIECTYLEESKAEEAERRGHIWWGGLLPHVQKCHRREGDDNNNNNNKTWILVHFSLRYPDQDIISFFRDEEQSGIRLEDNDDQQAASTSLSRPPDLVLWLDSGPHELWIASFC